MHEIKEESIKLNKKVVLMLTLSNEGLMGGEL